MNRKNFLERDFNQFSSRVVDAAGDGRLDSAPLIRMLERASIVAQGVSAVLRIERSNTVWSEAPDDEQPDPPLSSATMYSLLELARVSSESLVDEIERLAIWADKRCDDTGQV